MRPIRWLVLAVALAAASACGGSESFDKDCATNTDCLQAGITGQCLPSPASDSRWCGFPNGDCPSGLSWGIGSGDNLASTCVAGDVDAGGMADASVMMPDADPAAADASVTMPDASVMMPDAAVMMPDAAVIPPDAGVMISDAAVMSPDAAAPFLPQVSAGAEHTCIIADASGSVRCWGEGGRGQLGYGNMEDLGDNEAASSTGTVQVSDGARVVQLATGGKHSCALLDTGRLRCWGHGTAGALGYRNKLTIGDDEHPRAAGDVLVAETVVQVAAGGSHTCALLDNGRVRCWGSGYFGALGYANTANIGDDERPDSVDYVSVDGLAVQITAGGNHTCALLEGGRVRCWGSGAYGALGYGDTKSIGDDEIPSLGEDVNVGVTVIQIAAGAAHTCALLEDGHVRCWGDAGHGQLGYGNDTDIGDDEHPWEAGNVELGGTAVSIAAGGNHTCAVLASGALRCWGRGDSGALGYSSVNNIGDGETPASAGDVPVGGTVATVSAGSLHTCAVLTTGGIRCWGNGGSGRLGYGNTDNIGDNETPESVGDLPDL